MKTVWIYDNGETFKSFDSEEEAQAWLDIHDPEGVAFKHQLSDLRLPGSADQYGVPMADEGS